MSPFPMKTVAQLIRLQVTGQYKYAYEIGRKIIDDTLACKIIVTKNFEI